MKTKRTCYAGLALFAILSVTDFVQTYVLVRGTGGWVYESNPVANEWLSRYGWSGLAVFKAGAVLVVAGAVGLLAVRRPGAGVAVVAAACTALLWVTLYSREMMARAPAHGDDVPVLVENEAEW